MPGEVIDSFGALRPIGRHVGRVGDADSAGPVAGLSIAPDRAEPGFGQLRERPGRQSRPTPSTAPPSRPDSNKPMTAVQGESVRFKCTLRARDADREPTDGPPGVVVVGITGLAR